jgi:hypothetical protein
MSLYDEDDVDLWFEDSNGYDFVRVEFDTNDAVFDVNRGLYVIHPENIEVKLVNCAK